jgi:O-acetylhomoserine (thiol)-lyase
MEVTRNVPLLQVRQVEAYVKNEGRRWETSRAALSFLSFRIQEGGASCNATRDSMADAKFLKFDSLSLHAGQQPDPVTGARAVPIYQTTSYVFDDSDHAAALFNLESPGHIYSRISNPTVSVLEERIAALEGGVGTVCTASGHAALFLAIATLMDSGAHIVSSAALYGGSLNLFRLTLPRFGITTSFVNPRDIDGFRKAIRPETRLVFAETIGNPGLEVLDVPALAAVAHEAKLPLMVDATFTTPYLSRPIEQGADLVLHSATKWLGGHGLAIGGALVDGGKFDWEASGKFPTLTEPYAGYHGIDFAEDFGPAAFIMRARLEGLRDFGACMSPANAFYILQGVETLPLRMARHVENAQKVSVALKQDPAVQWVNYPGAPDSPDAALAKKLLPKGAGSMISFGVKGGRAAGRKFIDALKLASHLANVGDAKTLVIHPASTTHRQLDEAALKAAGIGEELIRLSVGLEDASDIIDDLSQALKASQKV